MANTTIFWFRRDLRLHDNIGLHFALTSGMPVLPLFIFDSNILAKLKDPSDKRVAFIHGELTKLKTALKAKGGDLYVTHGKPEEVFNKLLKKFPVKAVITNRDYEPYARERDQKIGKLCQQMGASFTTYRDQVIFEESDVLSKAGKPYTVFTPFKKAWLARLVPEDLASVVMDMTPEKFAGEIPYPAIPSLEELGFQPADPNFFPTREPDLDMLRDYHLRRDTPAIQGTSLLGLHLRFGTVSVRETARQARDTNETWLSELIWREFFMQILFHFPRVVNEPFHKIYTKMPWRKSEAEFQAWCEGRTGYPLVDAGMRELNATGYMHNRVRMVTASFLCKHLLLDWRLGEAYFAEKLLDFDLSANNGNWQWAAGTGCDAAPYFRVFNPSRQAERFDKDGAYIKRWVPEVGTPDYPEPMVEHRDARERAIATYKECREMAALEESK